ncbi:hypothetical protein [Pseudomonas typographi]|uniref:hypothetical protein n=1 Tax=Pseudomonas typographi TaxID=2715964 RepID=UPI00168898A5|nr:hypothetical protein [Pseudomonas typographi]MBD1554268.1 hypothetical protein [Pseudomonas typographi]
MNDELLAVPRATLRALFDAVIAGDEEGLAGHAPEMVKVRDMLDAPQPPVGGEPEVRGYVVAGSMFFLERLRAEEMTRGGKYDLVEVIDRAAYTALAAELDTAKQALFQAQEAAKALAAERDALQSELTKVRELLGRAREYGGLTPPWREAVSDLLAHQSAPARR